MKNKGPLILSTVITASLITMGIGVIRTVNAENVQATPTQMISTISADTREQAYEKLLAEANQKITLANQQIEDLTKQIPTENSETTSPYLFTSEQAAALAANIAGSLPESSPELVNFNNVPAYEVVYTNGKIYVDANSGKILFNGLQAKPTVITPEQAEKIASNYLGRSDVTLIDVTAFNGENVYVVGFSDGTQVYVNAAGKIVAIQIATQNPGSSGSYESEKDDD